MSNAPCRVSADLRRHDAANSGAEDFNAAVNAEVQELAQAMIEDGKQLFDLIYDYELTSVCDQLARCIREHEQAAIGNPISRDACMNAISLIKILVREKAADIVRDKAVHIVSERERLRGADE